MRIPKNHPRASQLYKEFIRLGLKSEVNRNPLMSDKMLFKLFLII
jgi:hypothetical protein